MYIGTSRNQSHAISMYHNVTNQDQVSNQCYEHTDNWEWINLNREKTGGENRENIRKNRQHTGVPGRRTRETQNGDFQCERTERKRGRDT